MEKRVSGGFIKIIILVAIGLIALGYFGLNIREILDMPVVRENLAYFWELLKTLWTDYLRTPALWLWEHVFRIFWDILREIILNSEGTKPSDLIK